MSDCTAWQRVTREHALFAEGTGGPCNCATCQAARHITTTRSAALEEAAQLVENECQCSHGSSLYDAASRIRSLKSTP